MNEENKTEETKKEKRKEIFGWIRFMVIVFAISLFANKCIVYSAHIPTNSMENTIMTDDRLIGNRLAYRNEAPKRLDVVIFRYPVNEEENFIKRIIGLPGETVRITDGKIYINDSEKPLDEPYLKEEWTVDNDGYVFHVPDHCYLMLGDNRNGSLDARSWPYKALEYGKAETMEEAEKFQYVSEDKILAKALFKYWKTPGLVE